MIIGLIGQEKNIGILTLTEYISKKLGNYTILGLNYLVKDHSSIFAKIDDYKNNHNVIIKYVVPRLRFSNQEIVYPEQLNDVCDIVFRIPSYLEEISAQPTLIFYKGVGNEFSKTIREFYLTVVK